MGRKHRHRRKTIFYRRVRLYTRLGVFLLVVLMAALVGMKFFEIGPFSTKYVEQDDANMRLARPKLQVELLTTNPYSRPGAKTERFAILWFITLQIRAQQPCKTVIILKGLKMQKQPKQAAILLSD